MDKWLISPPIVFIIIFLASLLLSYLFSRLSIRPKNIAQDTGKAYACGEEDYNHTAQPDYSIFFPFAFFFTLAHVATLIITTMPAQVFGTFVMGAIYVGAAALGLYILFRR